MKYALYGMNYEVFRRDLCYSILIRKKRSKIS